MTLSPDKSPNKAYRGPIYHTLTQKEWAWYPDGGLIVGDQGQIIACDHWNALPQHEVDNATVITLPENHLILPGLMDLHCHLPQMESTGRQETNLLKWLDKHIFPSEARFSDQTHAETVSRWFFRELLKNGTTTAAVFLTMHREATETAFRVAQEMGNRVVMGLNLMDRNAPENLTLPAETLLAETETLCQKWHGVDNGRLQYAWMPRFAVSCTETLLEGIGALREKYPNVYFHTHLSEQIREIEEVLSLFPDAENYTGVYDSFNLLGSKTLLAHGIYLSNEELQRLSEAGCSLVHCPSSNFFLKSGRFRWQKVINNRVPFGLGSDVGAGPELSMFKVMKDAQYMQYGEMLSVHQLLYRATLGGAKALMLDDRLGNFLPGKEADFIVVSLNEKSSVPHQESRSSQEIDDLLSTLIYLGDDRLIAQTFIRGQEVYARTSQAPTVSGHFVS